MTYRLIEMSRDMTKPAKLLCAQRRLRSPWASAQSDQSLRCALSGQLRTQGSFMRTAKTLIRLGGCPGWSESSLGAQPFCWFWHVAAQICFIYGIGSLFYTLLRSHPSPVTDRKTEDIVPSNKILLNFCIIHILTDKRIATHFLCQQKHRNRIFVILK